MNDTGATTLISRKLLQQRVKLFCGCRNCFTRPRLDGKVERIGTCSLNHKCTGNIKLIAKRDGNFIEIREFHRTAGEEILICYHKIKCFKGFKCNKAHSIEEFNVWKALSDHGVYLQELIQSIAFPEHEEPTCQPPPAPPAGEANTAVRKHNKKRKKKWYMSESHTHLLQRNNITDWLSNYKKFLDEETNGGRFLYACRNCYSLIPRIILEMDIGVGRRSRARCPWCNSVNKLLLYESVERVCKDISLYEYQVVRQRLSKSKASTLCGNFFRDTRSCREGKDCSFAHSYLELKIWKLEANDDSARTELVKYCNNEASASRTTLDGAFHCSLCTMNFLDNPEFSKHTKTVLHKNMTEKLGEKHEAQWKFIKCRKYKKAMKLCESTEETCIAGLHCTFAHCNDELSEWSKAADQLETRKKYAKAEWKEPYIDRLNNDIQSRLLKNITAERKINIQLNPDQPSQVMLMKDKKFSWSVSLNIPSQMVLEHISLLESPNFKLCLMTGNECLQHIPVKKQGIIEKNYMEFKIIFSHPDTYGRHVGTLILDFCDHPTLFFKEFIVTVKDSHKRMPIPFAGPLPEDWTVKSNPILYPRTVIRFSEMDEDEHYAKKLKELQLKYKPPPETVKYVDMQELTDQNYVAKMHDFLYKEEQARKKVLSRLNLECEAHVSKTVTLPSGMLILQMEGHLYAKFSSPVWFSRDTDEGILARDSCHMALVSTKTISSFAYEAKVETWEDNEVVLNLPKRCVSELSLEEDSDAPLLVQFQLDRQIFCQGHYAVDKMKENISFVCPTIDYATLKEMKKPEQCDSLDENQNAVYQHVLAVKENNPYNKKKCFPPLVVAGPFGTGKTHTIQNVILNLLRRNRDNRILLCTHSNSAADLYIQQVVSDARWNNWKKDILRVLYHGRNRQTHKPDVLEYCLEREDHKGFRYPTMEEVRKHRLIITTFSTALALGDLGTGLRSNNFSHIFLDEASQAMEAEIIIPLTFASRDTRIVIAGDHKQLTERVFSTESEGCSTFIERMYEAYEKINKKCRIILTNNYRCVKGILNLITKLFYHDVTLSNKGTVEPIPLMEPIQFIHIQGECTPTGKGEFINQSEVEQITHTANELINNHHLLKQEDVVVVSAYLQQVHMIRDYLRAAKLGGVAVQTVRNIQGLQYKAVIISTVLQRITCLGSIGENFGFLSDSRLLNTTVTRAQSLVIVVGDSVTLCSTGKCEKHWKTYIKTCEDLGTIHPREINLQAIKNKIRLAEQSLNPDAVGFIPENQLLKAATGDTNNPQLSENKTENLPNQEEAPDVLNNQEGESDDDDDDTDSWCTDEMEENSDQILDDILKGLGVNPRKLRVDVDNLGHETIKYDDEDDFDDDPNEVQRNESKKRNDRHKPIYPKYSVEQLKQMLKNNPSRYKRCRIQYQTFCSAIAVPLDFKLTIAKCKTQNGKDLIPENNNDEEESCSDDPSSEDESYTGSNSTEVEATNSTANENISQAPDPAIHIDTKDNLGRTFDNDEVVVQILEDRDVTENGKKVATLFGKVLGVLKRYKNPRSRQFLCFPDENNSALMVPVDKKISKIAILTAKNSGQTSKSSVCVYRAERREGDWTTLKFQRTVKININSDQRVFVVRYLKWSEYCPYPLGYVEKCVSLEEYKKYLSMEFDVPGKHRDTLEKKASLLTQKKPGIHDSITSVFTIDPEHSMDLDDALSIENCNEHKNCFKIGIHITDVASIIPEGSEVDKEARKRGTTFYMKDGEPPIHMLPHVLSTKKCSILPNNTVATISTYFHSSKKPPHLKGGEVVRPEKRFVKSYRRLTYKEAEDLLNTSNEDFMRNNSITQLPEKLCFLWQIMWEWRFARLDTEAFYKTTDSYDDLLHEGRAHLLIEEAMIVVNANTAMFLNEKDYDFPLRIQSSPAEKDWKSWEQLQSSTIPNSLLLTSCRKYLKKLKRIEEGAEGEEAEASDSSGEEWQEVFTRKDKKKKKKPNTKMQVLMHNVKEIQVYENIWRDLQSCWEQGRYDIFKFLIAYDDIHPTFMPGRMQYIRMQNRSQIQSRDQAIASLMNSHFSLRLEIYSWSSSPIRRYTDIIMQRTVHSALLEDSYENFGTIESMQRLSWHLHERVQSAKQYEEKILVVEMAKNLQKQPVVCIVSITLITDASLTLTFPLMQKHLLGNTGFLQYGYMMIDMDCDELKQERDENDIKRLINGEIVLEKMNLIWRLRYYDCKLDGEESKWARETSTVKIPVESWKKLIGVIAETPSHSKPSHKLRHDEDLKEAFNNMKSSCETDNTRSSDRMIGATRNNPKPIKHLREITHVVTPGATMNVQLSSSSGKTGLPAPSVQLISVAQDLEICIEHGRDPISTFAKDAMYVKDMPDMPTIQDYQMKWEPLIRMDSAYNATKDSSSITIDGVNIMWHDGGEDDEDSDDSDHEKNIKAHHYFKLNYNFCNERYIDLHASDLLCLRLREVPLEGQNNACNGRLMTKNDSYTVVVHGIIIYIKDKRKELDKFYSKLDDMGRPKRAAKNSFFFQATYTCSDILKVETPEKKLGLPAENQESFRKVGFQLYDDISGMGHFILNEDRLWTVEVLPLSNVHRHMHTSLQSLSKNKKENQLIQSICLGTIKPKAVTIPNKGEIFLKKKALVGFPLCLNEEQENQRQNAVRNNFTIIQGPPGTGKSLMGAQIAATLAYLNKMCPERKTLLYCGPSNKSVDVVAGFLLNINDLKVVRMYGSSLEEKAYPNPLRPSSAKPNPGDDGKMPDSNLKRISLHELIRKGNGENATILKKFDSKVRRPEEKFTRREVDGYFATLKEAKQEILKNCDIILCTCSMSKSLEQFEIDFGQCMIDECGMCSEPEALIALTTSNPKQIILIGDHKQLQPVIPCKRAERLGLGISLFSRYTEFAGMLTTQYRMHKTIMEFPSKEFYKNKLICDVSVLSRRYFPIFAKASLLYHVHGEEKTQYFKSIEGGEKSKYNMAESKTVIKLLVMLTNPPYSVRTSEIMVLSPYTAQCASIRENIKRSHSQLLKVHVGTVVTSQGSEADYVILSTVRSMPKSSIVHKANIQWQRRHLGFLTDPHQINVAITRARKGMCIIGNSDLLPANAVWKSLIDSYKKRSAIVRDFNEIFRKSN